MIKFTEIHTLNKTKAERTLDEAKEDLQIGEKNDLFKWFNETNKVDFKTKARLMDFNQDYPSSKDILNSSQIVCDMCYDILVVDDDESNLDLLSKHLTDTGWRVKQAHDG